MLKKRKLICKRNKRFHVNEKKNRNVVNMASNIQNNNNLKQYYIDFNIKL